MRKTIELLREAEARIQMLMRETVLAETKLSEFKEILLRLGGGDAQPAASQLSTLTERERETLDLMAQGLKTSELAEKMGVSTKTIESHKQNIKKKLGVASVHALYEYAKSHA